MKKFIFPLFVFLTTHVTSQITFEHTYDSAATYNFCAGSLSQLLQVDFEESGEMYVNINRCGNVMNFYDLNHALIKTIPLGGLPMNDGAFVGTIIYLSQHLFNTDSKIEFMYVLTSPVFVTMIYDEDLNLLFSEPGAPMIIPNIHLQQYPIYNTSAGTKMILSYDTGEAKVFGLGGTLTMAVIQTNEELIGSQMSLSSPIPNPSSSASQINYELPKGVNQGTIVIYDIQGIEKKRFLVDNTFNYLLLSTEDLPAGSYLYHLQIPGETSAAKKMIVIH